MPSAVAAPKSGRCTILVKSVTKKISEVVLDLTKAPGANTGFATVSWANAVGSSEIRLGCLASAESDGLSAFE